MPAQGSNPAPTLYRGRCFFGCRDGWLYALDLAGGQLAWRLRVAPLERRLVAFGQVESVWPALGSVLARHGVIYATAGQNSETDGGLAVVAVDAKAGKQLWATVIGAEFHRRNDLLQVMDDQVALCDYRMNPQTGKGALLRRPDGFNGGLIEELMEEGWTKANQRYSGCLAYGPKLVSHLLVSDASTLYGRDFAMRKSVAEKLASESPQPKDLLWKRLPSEMKPYALALASDTLVIAGAALQKQRVGGYVQLTRPSDGSAISLTTLSAPVIHQGIAVAHQRIYVCLSNGAVACLGQKP